MKSKIHLWLLIFFINHIIPKLKGSSVTISERIDGIGSQVHAVFSAFVFAKSFNLSYLHTPFRKVGHNYENDPNWERRIEHFFGFDVGFESTAKQLMEIGRYQVVDLDKISSILMFIITHDLPFNNRHVVLKKIHFHEYSDIFPSDYWLIKRRIIEMFFMNKNKYLKRTNSDFFTIACHIRRGDVNKNFPQRFTSNELIENNITSLISLLEKSNIPYKFKFYSQGSIEDFGNIPKFGTFILGDDPFNDIFQMVTADLLIMSKSSFSYVAALLSEGIVIYQKFWHSPLQNWFQLQDVQSNSTSLEKALMDRYSVIKYGL